MYPPFHLHQFLPTLETLENRDTPSVIISPTSGLQTSESGGYAIVNAWLNSAPTSNVAVKLISDNTHEGVVSTNQLIFTPTNWFKPQAFRVTGVEDGIRDGDQTYHVITTALSFDPRYHYSYVPDVTLRNLDSRNIAAFIVSPTSGLMTTEVGNTAGFLVQLTMKPSANVNIPIATSDVTEGRVSTSGLTFTPTTWNVPQRVTVTGVDDSIWDGDIPYSVKLLPAVSADWKYNNKDPHDVSLINKDNESSSMWNGWYLGTYTGSVYQNGQRYSVSGTVKFLVYEFHIYVSIPGGGYGTILPANNRTNFGSVTTEGFRVNFNGMFFKPSFGARTASGGWSFNQGGILGAGTWGVHAI